MSDNGQQVPLIERLRRVPAAARVLEHTPNPLGCDTTSIPVGALCWEAADRIAELERERDQYHAELDGTRAELAQARAERDALRAKLRAIVEWLERNRPEVWREGMWDAIRAAHAKEQK